MKYELEKDEFIAIHTTLKDMFSLTLEMVKVIVDRSHSIDLKRLDLEIRRLEFEEAKAGLARVQEAMSCDDEDYEHDHESDPDEDDPLHFPQEVPMPKAKAEPKAVSNEDVEVFFAFMELWLRNFNEKGPQPDRAEELRNMTIDGRARKIHTFFKAHGGMTKSIRAYLLGTDHPKKADSQFAFLVASNLCSVASIIYPPLIDQFDYVNPT